MVIHRMTIGRNNRGAPVEGMYCGQTTPTPRISAIISRRTFVSHSSHSRRLSVCTMSDAARGLARPSTTYLKEKTEERRISNRPPISRI